MAFRKTLFNNLFFFFLVIFSFNLETLCKKSVFFFVWKCVLVRELLLVRHETETENGSSSSSSWWQRVSRSIISRPGNMRKEEERGYAIKRPGLKIGVLITHCSTYCSPSRRPATPVIIHLKSNFPILFAPALLITPSRRPGDAIGDN